MGTIGVYDYDFMTYKHSIPNLECAKLYTYYHSQHEIAVLAPKMEPARYTKFFIRKDYDDGIYPPELFVPNCEYGGRAFMFDKYVPLKPEIENITPNMDMYYRYIDKFGGTVEDQTLIKRILHCAHMRLAPNSITARPISNLISEVENARYTGIILHDYDIASIKDSREIIKELSESRHFVEKKGINPYPIGNKFPIQVNSDEELHQWLQILGIPTSFFIQYNGIMENETLNWFCCENKRRASQLWYNISGKLSSENDFVMNDLPKIFKQVLLLRRRGIKILLKYDDKKIITPEIKTLIDLLNIWLSFHFKEEEHPLRQTLYQLCSLNSRFHYRNYALKTFKVKMDDARQCFQYFREKNYELFKMFYEWDRVTYKGGEIINESTRN